MFTSPARRGALALGLAAGLAALPAFAADKDPVLATVNGTAIRQSAVADFQRTLPPPMNQAPTELLLDVVINNQLVSEQAKKDGTANDPEVKQAIKQAEEKVVRQAWMSKKLKTEVTDAAVKARYDAFIAEFKPAEEVRARHILTETEDQAKAVIAELNGGAKFEDVARAQSKDPSARQNGGDLGYFAKEEMVPEFSAAAFAMKVGELSQTPVKSQFGWHVIKVEDKRLSSPPSFEEARPIIREQMAEMAAQKMVADLRAKAKIKRFNPDGTPVADEPASKK